MRYLLDTNACVDYIRNARGVRDQFELHDIREICISSVVYAELQFGVAVSKEPQRNGEALEQFCAGLAVLDFPKEAGQEYGEIRRDLQMKGKMIGANDLLIAAHARSEALTLITNDTGFRDVAGLAIEDWTAS